MSNYNQVKSKDIYGSISPVEIIDLLDGKFKEAFVTLPDEVMSLSETDLEKKFKATDVDFMLRKKFQELVVQCKTVEGSHIGAIDVYDEICSKQYFFTQIITNKYRIAWLLCPIKSFHSMLEDCLYFTIKKVRDEVLTMPVTPQTAGHIMKALEYFTNRVIGPVVQRVENKNMNVTVDGTKIVQDSINPENLMQQYADVKAKIVSLPKEVKTLETNVESEHTNESE